MSYSVAVDIGGTFTDLVAYDHASQLVICTKSPTTYDNFVDGILDCFAKAGISPNEARSINHGTTLVINALLQRRGAKAALVTTAGFRDILEIARGNRPDPFDLFYSRDEPLIPREMRFEIDERVNAKGEIVRPVDDQEIRLLAETIRAAEAESVAIFFMNSYANPASELSVAESLRRLLPELYVTCSVDLTREWYEYERCATVAANSYVGPQVDAYINRLREHLTAQGFKGAFFMMGSNGGLMSVDRARRQPVALVESGPVGGCIGAAAYAEALGLPNVIAFDMGGTTAKCAHIAHGHFSVDKIYYVGGYVKGFPVKASVLDITEVGSGGGSIAKVDPYGRLSVGPESAGSTPGPACYGRGGKEPTITDANLVLGRLNAKNFIGGELPLDVDAAKEAVASVAVPLGYLGDRGLAEMSNGIIAVAIVVMADAVRQVSIKQGLDPRDFVLFSYGGGGPLHACALARELSIPLVIIPPEPGNFSALGMLLSDARMDMSTTFVRALSRDAIQELGKAFAGMEATGREALARDFGARTVLFKRYAEMRFSGQRHDIKIDVSEPENDFDFHTAFLDEYRRRYGHANPDASIEIQALHVSAIIKSEKPDLARLVGEYDADAGKSQRDVYFGVPHGWVASDVYKRAALSAGFTAVGPALIEEYGSTTLVWPGDRLSIGTLGEMRVECAPLAIDASALGPGPTTL